MPEHGPGTPEEPVDGLGEVFGGLDVSGGASSATGDSQVKVAGRGSFYHSSWIGLTVTVVVTVLWFFDTQNWLGFVGPGFEFLFFLAGGPLVLAGLVMSIRSIIFRKQPRWVAIVGVVAAFGALTYIGFEFLFSLAVAAFA